MMENTMFSEKIKEIIKKEAPILNPNGVSFQIQQVLSKYNESKSLTKELILDGDGGKEYPLLSWSGQFCIQDMEYIPATGQKEKLLPVDWMFLDSDPSKFEIRLLHHTPQVDEKIKITYTSPYLEQDLDLIPVEDQDNFCDLVCCFCCEYLGRYHKNDPGKHTYYTERAAEKLKAYNKKQARPE